MRKGPGKNPVPDLLTWSKGNVSWLETKDDELMQDFVHRTLTTETENASVSTLNTASVVHYIKNTCKDHTLGKYYIRDRTQSRFLCKQWFPRFLHAQPCVYFILTFPTKQRYDINKFEILRRRSAHDVKMSLFLQISNTFMSAKGLDS